MVFCILPRTQLVVLSIFNFQRAMFPEILGPSEHGAASVSTLPLPPPWAIPSYVRRYFHTPGEHTQGDDGIPAPLGETQGTCDTKQDMQT